MSQQKKDIVEEMGFGALAHIPKMNVSHKLLRELIACYDDYYGYLDTLYDRIYITPAKIVDALGINHGGNIPSTCAYFGSLVPLFLIIDSFKSATLASLTKSVLDMSVEGEENRKKFKRTFVVFIQKCFLLPMTVSTASPIHKPHALCVDNIRQWDWATHVLSFLRKGIEARKLGKKQSIDGCVPDVRPGLPLNVDLQSTSVEVPPIRAPRGGIEGWYLQETPMLKLARWEVALLYWASLGLLMVFRSLRKRSVGVRGPSLRSAPLPFADPILKLGSGYEQERGFPSFILWLSLRSKIVSFLDFQSFHHSMRIACSSLFARHRSAFLLSLPGVVYMSHKNLVEMSTKVPPSMADWLNSVVLCCVTVADREYREKFRRFHRVCGNRRDEKDYELVTPDPEERVSFPPLSQTERPFFYYDCCFTKLGITLPFTDFETEILWTCNLASTQLHPNSWPFMNIFQLLCQELGVRPFLSLFLYLFVLTKPGSTKEKASWISFRVNKGRKVFAIFDDSFHDFNNFYFKVRAIDKVHPFFLDENDEPSFPLCWQENHVVAKYTLESLDEVERAFVEMASGSDFMKFLRKTKKTVAAQNIQRKAAGESSS
ncbi:hypothetical protein AHAS_Ahas17G0237100 [Arachis hypogaea]